MAMKLRVPNEASAGGPVKECIGHHAGSPDAASWAAPLATHELLEMFRAGEDDKQTRGR